MNMKKTLRLLLILALTCALALSSSITSSALFGGGNRITHTEELAGGGPYTLIIDHINTFNFRLWSWSVLSFSLGDGPIRTVTIDESAPLGVTLVGGHRTIDRLQVTVDETARTIHIGMRNRLTFYRFALRGLNIIVGGVEVDSIRFSNSGRAELTYADASPEEFSLNLSGRITADIGFSNHLSNINVDLRSNAVATLTGSADSATYNIAGFSRLHAFDFPVTNVNARLTGTSYLEQFFARDGRLTAYVANSSWIYYNFERVYLNEPLAPPVIEANLAQVGRIRRWFVRPE